MSRPKIQLNKNTIGSEFVIINVQDGVDVSLLAQESRTADGGSVLFELNARIATSNEKIEIEIRPAISQTIRQVYPSKNRMIRIEEHFDSYKNGSTAKRGVITVDNPFSYLKLDSRRMFALTPAKTISGISVGTIMHYSGIVSAGIVVYLALVLGDLFLIMLPKVHPIGVKRADTLWVKAMQAAGTFIVIVVCVAIEVESPKLQLGFLPTLLIRLFPAFVLGTVITSYCMKIYGSYTKLMYGERAPKARKVLAKLAHGKLSFLQAFFKDDDLMQ